MCSQSAGNAISETQILKISWAGHAPMTPTKLVAVVLGSHLRHRIGRYSRSLTQASICPRFYKRFVINHAILASTTGTLCCERFVNNTIWLDFQRP